MELEQNPVIEKLLNYAKNKNIISWEEISAFVGEEFFKSPEMEKVFQLLTQNNIQVVESSLEEEEDDDESLELEVELLSRLSDVSSV